MREKYKCPNGHEPSRFRSHREFDMDLSPLGVVMSENDYNFKEKVYCPVCGAEAEVIHE